MLRLNIAKSDRMGAFNQELFNNSRNLTLLSYEFARKSNYDSSCINAAPELDKALSLQSEQKDIDKSIAVGIVRKEVIDEIVKVIKQYKPSQKLRRLLNEMSFYDGKKGSNWSNLVIKVEGLKKSWKYVKYAHDVVEDPTNGAFNIVMKEVFLEKVVKLVIKTSVRRSAIGALFIPSELGNSDLTPEDFQELKAKKEHPQVNTLLF